MSLEGCMCMFPESSVSLLNSLRQWSGINVQERWMTLQEFLDRVYAVCRMFATRVLFMMGTNQVIVRSIKNSGER